MRKTALLISAIAGILLLASPAFAQRAFVSGSGSDANPCTFAQPCRTFQQAFNTVAANGEIDVLDPAGYGALTITKAISIQGHGFGGITATNDTNAITIGAGSSDAVSLDGLVIDGDGSGEIGIEITAAGSVQILNCVVRHFTWGIRDVPNNPNNPIKVLIADTITSNNDLVGIDIDLAPDDAIAPAGTNVDNVVGPTTAVTLNAITSNYNGTGVAVEDGDVMIANSVLSNNSEDGLFSEYFGNYIWLARSVVSGNAKGLNLLGGTVYSYGDNAINSNTTDVSGTLTSTSKQ